MNEVETLPSKDRVSKRIIGVVLNGLFASVALVLYFMKAPFFTRPLSTWEAFFNSAPRAFASEHLIYLVFFAWLTLGFVNYLLPNWLDDAKAFFWLYTMYAVSLITAVAYIAMGVPPRSFVSDDKLQTHFFPIIFVLVCLAGTILGHISRKKYYEQTQIQANPTK